jgi:uncharacterized membrane protein (DUF2068 family)
MADVVGTNIQRSSFVTALAWVFIVLAGFSTFIAALQNLMLSLMMPAGMPPMEQAQTGQNIPAFAKFMFANFRLIFAGFLVLSVITLATAVGLLKRKNWARVIFVAIMSFGILWNIGSVVLTFVMFSSMPIPENAPADFREQHALLSNIMTVATTVMAVAFTALFVWIIKRLLSNDIRREFVAL